MYHVTVVPENYEPATDAVRREADGDSEDRREQ
jgi:hypothetical protein